SGLVFQRLHLAHYHNPNDPWQPPLLYVLSTLKYHTWQTGCKNNVSILLKLDDALMKVYRQDGGQKKYQPVELAGIY
ncbi:MAG: hypothetical protein WBO22_18485, partial [Shewanella indica]|uniref:hypothetical protein n=1 Tax=Shewanella indica TaxID=768528 RepID=UPI003C71DF48